MWDDRANIHLHPAQHFILCDGVSQLLPEPMATASGIIAKMGGVHRRDRGQLARGKMAPD